MRVAWSLTSVKRPTNLRQPVNQPPTQQRTNQQPTNTGRREPTHDEDANTKTTKQTSQPFTIQIQTVATNNSLYDILRREGSAPIHQHHNNNHNNGNLLTDLTTRNIIIKRTTTATSKQSVIWPDLCIMSMHINGNERRVTKHLNWSLSTSTLHACATLKI